MWNHVYSCLQVFVWFKFKCMFFRGTQFFVRCRSGLWQFRVFICQKHVNHLQINVTIACYFQNHAVFLNWSFLIQILLQILSCFCTLQTIMYIICYFQYTLYWSTPVLSSVDSNDEYVGIWHDINKEEKETRKQNNNTKTKHKINTHTHTHKHKQTKQQTISTLWRTCMLKMWHRFVLKRYAW